MATMKGNPLGYVTFGDAKMGINTTSGISFKPLTPTGTGTSTVPNLPTGNTSTTIPTSSSNTSSSTSTSTSTTKKNPDPVFAQTYPNASPATPINKPDKPNPTVPADPIYNGYHHFADEIGETTNLHWFTQDERELLIAIYNKLKGGLSVFISPEARILTWTIQPGSYSGLQKFPIVCPFDGTLVGLTAASIDWGGQDMDVVIQKATETNINSGNPVFSTVGSFILKHLTANTNQKVESYIPATNDIVPCAKGEVYDVCIVTPTATLGLVSPAVVQLFIKLKDGTANVGIDLSGLKYDPTKYLPKT